MSNQKKKTPESLANQFISLSEPSGATSSVNPPACVCFGGHCWRQLCHQKTYKEATRVDERPHAARVDERPHRRLPPPKGQITVWRWDGSHEQGRVDEGRIPSHVSFDQKGHPIK